MQFAIPGCKPDEPLRVSSKMVHLTFAALREEEHSLASMLAAARSWGAARQGLREYTIGKEIHSAPARPERKKHFHLYLKFGKKVEVRNRLHTTVFDLRGRGGRVLHPEVQTVKNTPADRERVIRYDMKDGEYIGELQTPLAWRYWGPASRPQPGAASRS